MSNLLSITIKDNNKTISGKQLHKELGVKASLNYWFNKYAKKTMLKEDIDYVFFFEKTNGRPSHEYIINIDSAIKILLYSIKTNKKASTLYNQLSKEIDENSILITTQDRKESLFYFELETILKGIVKIEKQYQVGFYKIDYYIKSLNLAIEYDEYHHVSQSKKDKKRENIIKEKIGCKFIRIKEGKESIALNKILKHFIKAIKV